jgi:WD40 repeat protein
LEHAVFSLDGTRVATLDKDHSVHVWDCANGRELNAPLEHKADVFYAAFSLDGRHLATACADRTAYIWNLDGGEPIAFPLKCTREIERVGFRPDARQLVVILQGGFMKTWNLATEDHSREDLISLAQVLSEREVGAEGTLLRLDAKRVHSAWKHLRSVELARMINQVP